MKMTIAMLALRLAINLMDVAIWLGREKKRVGKGPINPEKCARSDSDEQLS